MIAIHVLPEIVLCGVDGHEGDHHHVGRMFSHQVKTRTKPLTIEFLHLGEDLMAPWVGGHVAEIAEV